MGHVLLFGLGYALATMTYYANHRWVFHGKPRGPEWLKTLWKRYTKYHMRHHAKWHRDDPETKKWLRTPAFAKLLSGIGLIALSMIVGPGMPIGIATFFIVYGIRHGSIHGHPPWPFKSQMPTELSDWKKASHVWKHHMSHHLGNPNVNYSGVHPFIDQLFETYQDPDDILSQSKLVR